MTLWILFAVMSVVAIGFVVWPLYRHQKSMTPVIALSVIFIVAVSSGLYYKQGQPELPSGADAMPDIAEMVNALAARLQNEPNDLEGWTMLGRSYMTTGDYAGAVDAFERAVQLDSAQDPRTLVALGEALLASTGAAIDGRISSLFENALALEQNNPQALFYGGIGAFNRDDTELAAERWERLLALNPPDEIQGILRERIAEWRGEPLPDPLVSADPIERSGTVVNVQLSLTDAAADSLPSEATVFVIARDPAQPAPPIAVARRRLSELPAAVDLGDRESMIPGRSLSGFAEFELVARVSVSGQPTEQSGDWYGAQIVKPAENDTIELSINQQVP